MSNVGTGGSIRILWDADDAAEVTITGNNLAAFTVGGSAVTFPYTLSASTTFKTIHNGTYTVSVKHHGIEVAGTPDGTRTVVLENDTSSVFAPSADSTPTPKFLDELSATFGMNERHGEQWNTQQSSALQRFHAALATRDTAPCNIVVFGDSMNEGPDASSDDHRWISRLRKQLRQRLPVDGLALGSGVNFYPPAYAANNFAGPVTTTGTWTANLAYGPGCRCMYANAAATMTFTFTGTDFAVMHVGSPSTGTFTVAVDGGAAVTVDTSAGYSIATDGALYTVNGLASGSHTVVVSWVSGYIYIDGFLCFDGDYSSGIRVYDSSHSGWTSGQFVQELDQASQKSQWAGSVGALNPHLVTIGLGMNDEAIGPVTPSTFQTNLGALIAAVRATSTTDPSFVLIAFPQRNGTFTYPWSNYVDAMWAIADSDAKVTVLDLTLRFPAYADDTIGWHDATDHLHPSDLGHAMIADVLTDFLLPK